MGGPSATTPGQARCAAMLSHTPKLRNAAMLSGNARRSVTTMADRRLAILELMARPKATPSSATRKRPAKAATTFRWR